MDTTRDYYAILGVLATAEDIVIHGAYRALAQRYHPDRYAGSKAEANAKMAEINEAHRILSDAALRSEYDQARLANPATARGYAAGSDMAVEIEQYHAFAQRLLDWGYDEAAIQEALRARGVRPPVAEYLAQAVIGQRQA